jgi:predicted RNA-binding protein YlxR (DUF448 family)
MLAVPQAGELDAGPRKTPGTERFCAVTGAVRPVDDMIRFVVAPDGSVAPDLKRRLPGRGIWITATRQAIQKAIERKAFARSFKRDVRVPADLVGTIERLLERSTLESLGIARKAGKIAAGFTNAGAAIAQKPVTALLHAADAAPDGVRKLGDAVRRRGDDGNSIAVVRHFTSAQLDLALGRSNVIHAALLAGPESKAFLARHARLMRFRAGNRADGTEPAEKPQDWNANG